MDRYQNYRLRIRQSGGLTIFTGIFVLVLMTMMLFYASSVGLFEQRTSANDANQKIAFHAAESAVAQGLEYVWANGGRLFSDATNAMPDGAGGVRAGWFANDGTTPGWVSCSGFTGLDDHPCGGDYPANAASFFYDDPTTNSGTDSLPIDTSTFPADTTARVSMLLCIVDDFASFSGNCGAAPSGEEEANSAIGIVTLMGYGFTDCTDTTDLSTCTAEARIYRPLTSYKNLDGTPAVPLTTKSTFPPSGTAEVVANPDGGGLGVPLTTWINDNPSCAPATDIISSGNWQTCEFEEWYGINEYPDDVECPASGNCQCGPGGNDTDYFLSWRKAADTNVNIDIIIDDGFPCDLFEYYFGVPRAQYDIIKGSATVIDSCAGLDENSTGLYWATGSACRLNGGGQYGSPESPLILISAASVTSTGGGSEFFGTLYIFDGEDANAELDSSGNFAVYGAVIVDAEIDHFTGTFQIIYANGVLANAQGLNGVGTVSSGWRDWGLPDWN